VPVNWAVLHGESRTGATLHEMVEKPDAGRIVDQMAVPILPDDLAVDVFRKVTVAAEIVLDRSLPALLAGTAALREQDLASGSYFGARRAGDGRIDWSQPGPAIHNLVRAVAPPYPGAFADFHGTRLRILRTLRLGAKLAAGPPALLVEAGWLIARCADGTCLRIARFDLDGREADAAQFNARFGPGPHFLGTST
jgi:methionyl-tRNA formyltransferase